MRLAVLAFAAGVLLLQAQPALPPPYAYPTLIGLAVLALAGCRKRSQSSRFLVAAACLLAGFGWAGFRAEWRLDDFLPSDLEGRDIMVVGVVAELPQSFPRGDRFVFAVDKVMAAGAVVPSRLLLSRYRSGGGSRWTGKTGGESPSGDVELRAGQRWQLTVRLKRPHGNINPHGFDYEAWLLEREIRAVGYVRQQPAAVLLDDFVPGPTYVVERLRQTIRSRFLQTLAGDGYRYAGILVALTVGDQHAIDGALWQSFARTATTHLMSISGLHVTMVSALMAALTGGLWRRSPRLLLLLPAPRAAIVAGAIAALLYAFLAGFSVPAQRTLYMLGAGAAALLCSRRSAPSRTASLALLVVLMIDPWAVLSPGFWLSFGAVSLLFYVARERRERAGGMEKRRASWRDAVAGWGAAQWAVTIGTLPLLLFFFQRFSLVSPLANALAIPAISLLVTPLALLAAVIPVPALLHLDHWLLAWVMRYLGWLAGFPQLEVPAPPPWQVVVALTGVAWLLLPRGWPARWLGACLCLPLLLGGAPRPATGKAWITVLDVGQGLAVVVRTATKTLLYDTGPQYGIDSDAGQRLVLPFLRAAGVGSLDMLIVTHGDSDHAGGVGSVVSGIRVDNILSSLPELTGERCRAGQTWSWDGVSFRIMHPTPGTLSTPGSANHASCVLRVEAGGESMLLTSDIEAGDERRLLGDGPDRLRSDVLLVPHHGSRTSSTPDFIAAVSPSQVVYPVGYRNRFGHPRRDIVARYGDRPSWRTDLDGAVEIRLGDGPAIVAERRRSPRYWYGH